MAAIVEAPVKGMSERRPGGFIDLSQVTALAPAGDEVCNYEYSYDDLFTERLRAAGQPVTHLQVPLPPEYVNMAPADLDARIAAAR
ncbi:MAG: hypothetical protein ACRDJN_15540, partial [Chloroflexota bacterium]